MNDKEEPNIDEEPVEGGNGVDDKVVKRKQAYQKLKRDLSEDELNNSGTQKMLLNDLDRLEDEVFQMRKFREDFHSVDKERAILKEKLNATTSKEVLFSVAISLGAILMGFSNSLWAAENNHGPIILIIGGALVLGGIISKFFWR